VVLDIPCGDGRASHEFLRKGATVRAFDLHPHFMKLTDVTAEYADLADPLPLESGSIDLIICQEGIEHLPDQLRVLEEFNRVLKPGGLLLLTTPSNSHVRARLSLLFLESDYWKRMPPTEIDGVWFAGEKTEKLYFGHLFLLGVQHLQTLLTVTGFRVQDRVRTNVGNTSLILGTLLYPLLALVSLVSWLIYRRKNTHLPQADRDRILWERVKLNLSPRTLFCKHLFWVAHKDAGRPDVRARLKNLSRIEG
jgi:SAM-dependent methyltransferase